MRGLYRSLIPALAAGPVFLAAAGPATADVLILGTEGTNAKRGTVLTDTDTITLPAGAHLKVLTPAGRAVTLTGQGSWRVSQLSAGETRNEVLWRDIIALLPRDEAETAETAPSARPVQPRSFAMRQPTEPSGDAGKRPSGARNGRGAGEPARTRAPQPAFSWRSVPLEAEGDICVEKGAPLTLARAGTSAPVTVTVVDVDARIRAAATFKAGSATAPWPADIAPHIGVFAVVAPPETTARQFRLRLIAPLPAADETLRFLHSQRCRMQLQAWLRGVAVASH